MYTCRIKNSHVIPSIFLENLKKIFTQLNITFNGTKHVNCKIARLTITDT